MLRAITRDIIPVVWRADRFAPRGFGQALQHTEGHLHSRSPIGGERLLQYWQERLAPQHRGSALLWNARDAEAFKDSEVKDLLHTAVRLRQGRVAGVLPEQVHPSSCSTLVRQGSNVMSGATAQAGFSIFVAVPHTGMGASMRKSKQPSLLCGAGGCCAHEFLQPCYARAGGQGKVL